MAKCCYCGAMNIDGADNCEQCLEPIGDMLVGRTESDVERSLLSDTVARLLPRKPIIVAPTVTVREVLHKMVEHTIGCVLIVDDGQLVGVFTERDAVVRIGAALGELGEQAVGEFMTTTPETVECDAQIAYALQKMDSGGYRHLPVMTNGRIVGVISIRDVLQYLAHHLEVVEY